MLDLTPSSTAPGRPLRRGGGSWCQRGRWALLSLGLARGAWAEPPLPPLPDGPGYERLPVPGYLSAVVAWPAAAHAGALPVAIATHGSFDQPEWNCETYQHIPTPARCKSASRRPLTG